MYDPHTGGWDMLGKRVGDWKVIEFAGHDKHKMKLWLCRCKCGYERVFGTSYLNSGGPSMCPDCRESLRGTANQELQNNFVGAQVGEYTVIRLAGQNKYGSRLWLCRCKCGYEREFLTAALSGNGRRSATRCPGCTIRKMEEENREVSGIPHRFWKRFTDQAARRNIPVLLTREEAQALYESQDYRCALSGEAIYFTRLRTNFNRYTTASLDRVDSSRPYELGNVQWVHKVANMMKGTLSQAEFFSWCQRVARVQGLVH